jgi:hypothetical protein
MTERQATCSCGKFKVHLSGDPQLVSSCHCQACQRRTGALFGSTSFWRKSQVLAIEGERRSWRRVADSGTGLVHQFCPTCGSTVYWESESTPEMMSVAVGSFADPKFPAPVRTVWTATKHPWLPFPESIPRYEKSP